MSITSFLLQEIWYNFVTTFGTRCNLIIADLRINIKKLKKGFTVARTFFCYIDFRCIKIQ